MKTKFCKKIGWTLQQPRINQSGQHDMKSLWFFLQYIFMKTKWDTLHLLSSNRRKTRIQAVYRFGYFHYGPLWALSSGLLWIFCTLATLYDIVMVPTSWCISLGNHTTMDLSSSVNYCKSSISATADYNCVGIVWAPNSWASRLYFENICLRRVHRKTHYCDCNRFQKTLMWNFVMERDLKAVLPWSLMQTQRQNRCQCWEWRCQYAEALVYNAVMKEHSICFNFVQFIFKNAKLKMSNIDWLITKLFLLFKTTDGLRLRYLTCAWMKSWKRIMV